MRTGKATSEWTLWVVAVSCTLHPLEEYFTGWRKWAEETLGIAIPTSIFAIGNAAVAIAALMIARKGWRRPVISLVIPSLTLVNALFFHILPTVVQSRISPGIYTATLLYVPFSSWALIGAARDGVPRRAVATALLLGALMMMGVVLGARSLSFVS